jgi:hypothetical protein
MGFMQPLQKHSLKGRRLPGDSTRVGAAEGLVNTARCRRRARGALLGSTHTICEALGLRGEAPEGPDRYRLLVDARKSGQ